MLMKLTPECLFCTSKQTFEGTFLQEGRQSRLRVAQLPNKLNRSVKKIGNFQTQ